MRTRILILAGAAIGAAALYFSPVARRPLVLGLFAVGWLLVCLLNLRTGLSHGSTLSQEAPFHAVLYAAPLLFTWWFSRRLR
jgi:hypothetical protein